MNGQAITLDKGVTFTEDVGLGTVVGTVVVVVMVFTATATGEEIAVADALSVTCISKFQVPSTGRLPVDIVGKDDVSQLNELPRLLYELEVGDS